MTTFQRLALATTVATYILVVIGGTVRVTGSGLACPDWPTCNGSVIPAFNEHVLIEYSHRLFASIVSVLVAGSAALAWMKFRHDRAVVGWASIAVGVLVVQVLLGAVTVRADLPASIVTAHLGTAMLLLASVTMLTLISFQRTRQLVHSGVGSSSGPRAFRTAAFVAAAGMYVLLLSGAYTASSGAGAACSTWPLCNGQVFAHGQRLVDIHFTHRVIVAVVTVAIAVMAVGAYRWLPNQRAIKRAVCAAAGLYILQIFVGALNVWTSLATSVRILHLATGAALWLAFGDHCLDGLYDHASRDLCRRRKVRREPCSRVHDRPRRLRGEHRHRSLRDISGHAADYGDPALGRD